MKIRTNFIIQIFAHGFQRIKPIYTDKKSVLIRQNPCYPWAIFIYFLPQISQISTNYFLVLQKKTQPSNHPFYNEQQTPLESPFIGLCQ